MSETSERYARLASQFAAKIAAVPDDRWDSPSPCEGWTVRDLVRHVVSTQGQFLGFIGRELGEVPSVDDDPVAAWTAASNVMQAELENPERAQAQYDGLFGRTTLEQSVDGFGCFDLVVHGWDVAHAVGLDETIEPDEVKRVAAQAHRLGDTLRSQGACGPALDPPPDADEQTQLLALLGRRAW